MIMDSHGVIFGYHKAILSNCNFYVLACRSLALGVLHKLVLIPTTTVYLVVDFVSTTKALDQAVTGMMTTIDGKKSGNRESVFAIEFTR